MGRRRRLHLGCRRLEHSSAVDLRAACSFTGRYYPRWSPDGTEILVDWRKGNPCFHDEENEWRVFDVATGQRTGGNYYTDCFCDVLEAPGDWTPDSARLLFGGSNGGFNRAGDQSSFQQGPYRYSSWIRNSPDGKKVVLQSSLGSPPSLLYISNPDGSGETMLSAGDADEHQPDWQPILRNYPRPKGATPDYLSLVPAYDPCTTPNRTHQAPLSYGSCYPPSQSSGQLTVGTPDANMQGAKSTAYVRLAVGPGNPQTPADEAELGIDVQITDVRNRSDLSDYTGQVEVRLPARLTDKRNSPYPGGEGPGTAVDFIYPVVVGCSGTADTTIGSTCELHTSFDAITPDAIVESKRSIWQIGQIDVYDGGPDGLASTSSGNTLFETQGVFVP